MRDGRPAFPQPPYEIKKTTKITIKNSETQKIRKRVTEGECGRGTTKTKKQQDC